MTNMASRAAFHFQYLATLLGIMLGAVWKAFAAMTADVIYTQFFGARVDYLSDPDFSVPWCDAFIGL